MFNLIGKECKVARGNNASSVPTLTLTGTKDKFEFNQAALDLMNLKEGDKVSMFDLNKGAEASNLKSLQNGRFLICKNDFDEDVKSGKIGANNSFSNAGAYSVMINNEDNVTSISLGELKAKGLIGGENGKSSAIKGTFRVLPIVKEDGVTPEVAEVAEGVTVPIFGLYLQGDLLVSTNITEPTE